MRLHSALIVVTSSLCLSVSVAGNARAEAIALKSGESTDLGTIYWVENCRSILNTTPTAEILEGPSELSVTIKPGKVLPRKQGCAKPVDGGTLTLTAAKELKTRLEGKMTIRVNYATKDGNRQNSRQIDYTLIP